jgi:dihydrofolate reductase
MMSRLRVASFSVSADGKDVRLGGGVATVCQYLQARLIDEWHLAVAPVLLGSEAATHLVIRKLA